VLARADKVIKGDAESTTTLKSRDRLLVRPKDKLRFIEPRDFEEGQLFVLAVPRHPCEIGIDREVQVKAGSRLSLSHSDLLLTK
jgi:hypothetical protein